MLYSDVPVRGSYFRGADVVNLVNTLTVGTRLELEREPENEYDANAIKVLYDGVHIGYVGKEIAAYLAVNMDEGGEFSCIVTSIQAGRKGNFEPWVHIGSEETIDEIAEQIIDQTFMSFGNSGQDEGGVR